MTTPTEHVLHALIDCDCDPQPNGSGWTARCPAHDDHRPSLSVSEGDDGRALVHCHRGCDVHSVCDALEMTASQLMVPDCQGQNGKDRRVPRRRQRQAKKRTFLDASDAIKVLERQLGQHSAKWTYHDERGEPIGVIVRWETSQGKEIRPISLHDDGWVIGGFAEPRPLYNLPNLVEADRVFIVEGEKAADAAHQIGLPATTSPGGSQVPEKADWSVLAGKECVILPDNDEPGEQYAEKVQEILQRLSPAPQVSVIHLTDLPSKGDIADWIEAQPDKSADELQEIIDSLLHNTDPVQSKKRSTAVEDFVPFPVDELPEPLRNFVYVGAKAIGCDTSFLALPLLTAIAAAIGNSRILEIKRGWRVPPIIWTAIVGESGTSKTPAFQLVMKPMRERQRKAIEEHEKSLKQHEAEIAQYEKHLSIWKKSKKADDPAPAKPDPPTMGRCIVGDTTVEALAPLLLANPRGLLLARDELSGWFGSFDRYANGKGSADASHWLSLFNGESIMVDRKTGAQTLYVPRAAVSVCGGIQPAILHRALGIEHRESGLAARLLLTSPQRKVKQWTDADIAPQLEDKLATLIERLFELSPMIDSDENQRPAVLELDQDALAAWIEFYDAHNEEQASLTGELAAAWSKLEEYAARLALVIHCVRVAAQDTSLRDANYVDSESMRSGIVLTKWFKHEIRRVYSILSETESERDLRELVEWIVSKGGVITARQVQQGRRSIRTADEAEALLKQLVKRGDGKWQDVLPGSKGGRSTRQFHLFPST